MSTLDINGNVPFYPDSGHIKLGLLAEMFKPGTQFLDPCGLLKAQAPGTSFDKKLVSADNRADYLAYLEFNGWYPPDPEQFAKPGYLLDMKLQRILCPWGKHAGVKIAFRTTFGEGWGGNESIAEPKIEHKVWSRGSGGGPFTFSGTVTSNPVPDPQPGSSGPFTASFEITLSEEEEITCLRTMSVKAKLESGGWDALAGQTVEQTQAGVSCVAFRDGEQGLFFFWQAIGPDLGDVDLVRGFTLTIYADGFEG